MKLKDTFKTAVGGLKTNKSRSALTILGIVIGITAIILIMSLGAGAEELIVGQLQGLGSKTIVVIPGREPSGPTDPSVIENILSDSLKQRELDALRRPANAPYIREIMPAVFGVETASYGGETFRMTMLGGTELAETIFDLSVERGRFVDDDDVRRRADVVVLGARVKNELFGQSDALGERIKIRDRNMRVIGVLPEKGQVSLFNFDEVAFMPYTTAQQYILGIKHFNRFIIEAETEEAIPQTVRDIEITLRNLHGITDPEKDDFFVETQADLIDRISVVTDVLTLFLVSVAAISLIVGGIGVMNIMLVSVTERTREIGLRKAVGATNRNILMQFLLEAIILTSVGGIIGITLGASLAFFASIILSNTLNVAWQFSFPFVAALLGIGVSAGVGLAFGLYPARQAAQKEPIEALRYE